jgi:hypothetical protein
MSLSGIDLPPRREISAVTTHLLLAALILDANASAENPAKTTE